MQSSVFLWPIVKRFVKQPHKKEWIFAFLMSDKERWDWVRQKSGIDLLNELLRLIAAVRDYDKVILIGSDKRLHLMKGLLDRRTEIFPVVIGRSPMAGDVYVNPESFREMIREIRG